jgi:hypothetical protein
MPRGREWHTGPHQGRQRRPALLRPQGAACAARPDARAAASGNTTRHQAARREAARRKAARCEAARGGRSQQAAIERQGSRRRDGPAPAAHGGRGGMERRSTARPRQIAPAHRPSVLGPLARQRGRRSAVYDAFMPGLVCPACGRRIFTTEKLDSLFGEERRCPRCGADLRAERREVERRDSVRRQNAPHDPGPPAEERRVEERRKGRRRRQAGGNAQKRSDWGWSD